MSPRRRCGAAFVFSRQKKGPKAMPCFRPLNGYRGRVRNTATKKRPIVFNLRDSFPQDDPRYEELPIPCGQCIGCRLERSRQVAMRAIHEASLYEDNCFVTLTYASEHLPPHGSLDYKAPVLFMERLRDYYSPKKIRSYGCAEYGEKLNRPHYHLLIFNHKFTDTTLIQKSAQHSLYKSKILSQLWPYGHSSVGDLTFESAAYVARYCTKKITGPAARKHYETHDPRTGEVFERLPERPVCVPHKRGLGRDWYEKNRAHSQRTDFLILRGQKVRPAKYYDRLFDLENPERFAIVKASRKQSGEHASLRLKDEEEAARKEAETNGNALPMRRLDVMEIVQQVKATQLKRNLENG